MSTAKEQENKMSVETATEQQQDDTLLCNSVVKGTKEDIDKLQTLTRLKGKTAYKKIKHLIGHGYCMDWSIETMLKKRSSAYQQITDLLQYPTDDNDIIMLTQKEVDSLCDYYKFFIHDVHGYYPDENCQVLRLLRTAKICDDVDESDSEYNL